MKASVNFSMNSAIFTSKTGESRRVTATPEKIAQAKKLAYNNSIGHAYKFLTQGD